MCLLVFLFSFTIEFRYEEFMYAKGIFFEFIVPWFCGIVKERSTRRGGTQAASYGVGRRFSLKWKNLTVLS